MYSQFWTCQSHIKSLYSDCVEPVLKKYKLTRMELDVLMFLSNNPQFDTATDIIENRRLTKSHVSLAVDSIVKRGFLHKTHALGNRKTIHLSVLDCALPIVHDGKEAQKKFGSILFYNFSSEDRKQINRLFEQINTNLNQYFQEEQ
ncbi:MAG: MarR family winged helix-turn-helix transcriptional regulator [Lachnospiraceae bacterium]